MLRMACLLTVTCCLSACAFAQDEQPLQAFGYPTEEAARVDWVPQYDSPSVRVERLEDGSTCLALDAPFEGEMDRATWDWEQPLDLSDAAYVRFEVQCDAPDLLNTVGFYFGTEGGWYARFIGGLSTEWTERTLRLDAFKPEENPRGWDQIIRMRFSAWSQRAGETVFRLRNLRVLPADPGQNFVTNGSFEIVSGGLPYAWSNVHWGVGSMPWVADMDLWRAHFRLDDTDPRHGERCLLLDNAEGLPLLQAATTWMAVPGERDCVFSAWLRADREGLPVDLRCGNARTSISVGTRWAQYALAGVAPGDRLTGFIQPKEQGKLWIDAVQLQALDEPTQQFHPAFDEASLAEREAAVDWSYPPRTDEIAAGRDPQGPVAFVPTTIDEHGRFLLGLRPYIQHSLGLEFVRDLRVLDAVAANGFRDVTIQIRGAVTTEELVEVFDRCSEVGLRVIPWMDRRIPRERYRAHIEALRDHPALLVWYVYDEPSGEDGFAEANARLAIARELDPDHPAFTNYLSNKLEGHEGAIYSTDVYPVPRTSPMAAVKAVRRMQGGALAEGKPVWMWLQGTGYAYFAGREPTPRELSFMVYGSLIEGARGIYYFAQFPRSEGCLAEMRALLVEVEALRPWLTSVEEAPEVTAEGADLLLAAYRVGDELCVLSANMTSEQTEAELAIEDVDGPVTVMFEDRSLPAKDGAWTDAFGPWERHVYRLQM
ncbi:MAG: hypothetical protein GF393_09330 [Armatimonadia bacterium]|nr:hypothetical protein [Armatimonadia bacterium]